MKRAYNRRGEFMSMIQEAAEAEGSLPEDIVKEWTEKFQRQTINSIREALKAKQAKMAIMETQVPLSAEAMYFEIGS
ncbi:hypothetical protein BGZ95_009319 [Linnemannia exigua]|uniref:Uncharacterized protein n=1 Tax=Linnemannia exigua TaxID=604196 RepID=A0AAD4H7Z1_9FUNG|nr:hypothetical protein BGZ95_009319 [Linnemannia exigua]